MTLAGHGQHRISFYPRGLKKTGNTVCTFVAPKDCGHQTWMMTTDPAVAMRKWEECRPSGTHPTRLQSVEFTDVVKSCIVRG